MPAGIWGLSLATSGILVRFTSTSRTVAFAIEREGNVDNTDDIFTTNGKQGFDVHVQDASLGAPQWRWAATEAGSSVKVNGSLVMNDLPQGTRNFTVYLPTYARVSSLRVGVEVGSGVGAGDGGDGAVHRAAEQGGA